MRQNDGSLFFDTSLDVDRFKKDVDKLESIGKTAIAGFTAAAVTGLGAAVKVGMDFEAQMSKVGAISMASAEDMEILTQKAKEMGETTVFSASQAGEAFEYMAMAGWKAQDMASGIAGIMDLAAASGESLATVSDIVTDALTAFGLKAADSGRFADVLAAASSNANTNVGMMGETFKYVAPLAGSLGYSVEDTAVAIGLMANAGIKAGQAGTSLRSILTRLAKPTGESKDAIKALGLSVTDSSGKIKPFNVLMKEMRTAFSKLNAAQKPAYAAMLGGQEAMSGLLAIVNASESDFEKLTDAVNNSSGAASEMAERNLDNLKGSLTLAGSAAEAFGIAVYEEIEGPLRSAVDAGTEFIQNLTEGVASPEFAGNVTLLATTIGIAAAAMAGYRATTMAAAAAQALLNTTITLNPIGLAVGGIAALAATTASVVIAVRNAENEWYKMGESVEAVSSKFEETTEKATISRENINTWRELKTQIDNNKLSGEQLATAQGKVKELELWFIDNYGSFITAEEQKNGIRSETVDLVEKEAEALTEIAALQLTNELLDKKSEIPELEKRVAALKKTNEALEQDQQQTEKNITTMILLREEWRKFNNSADSLDEVKVKEKFEEIRKAAEGIVDLKFNTISSELTHTVIALEGQSEKLGKAIEDNNQKITDGAASIAAYKDGVQQLIDFKPDATFEEKVTLAQQFGVDFADGVIKGLDLETPAVMTAIDELAAGMIEEARKKADVNSPSKKARDLVGMPIGEGVAVGVKKSSAFAAKAAGGLIDTVLAAARKEADINSPAGIMIDGVGKWLSLGVAQGIEENSDAAVKSFNKMLEKLQYQREFDIINEKEYYTELERLRDKYFKVGTKEWLDYTGEIYNYQKKFIEDLYSDIASFANDKLDAVISRQEDFASKLSSFGGLFNTNTVHLGDETFTFYSMHDFEKDTQAITEYCDNLQKLKDRFAALGADSDTINSFISELAEEDISTGSSVLNTLLSAGDDKLSQYITGYSRKNTAAEKLSSSLYRDDLNTAIDSSIENMRQKLTEAGYEIPEGFFVSGSISAEKFGEAFLAKLEDEMKGIREKITDFNAKLELELASVSGTGAYMNNTYSPTYQIIASPGESTAGQLRTIRNEEKLNKMRGGY